MSKNKKMHCCVREWIYLIFAKTLQLLTGSNLLPQRLKTTSPSPHTYRSAKRSQGLHDSDRDYCEKFRLPPSSPDFMTYEALVAEESKLLEMVNIIVEEKKFRDLD